MRYSEERSKAIGIAEAIIFEDEDIGAFPDLENISIDHVNVVAQTEDELNTDSYIVHISFKDRTSTSWPAIYVVIFTRELQAGQDFADAQRDQYRLSQVRVDVSA